MRKHADKTFILPFVLTGIIMQERKVFPSKWGIYQNYEQCIFHRNFTSPLWFCIYERRTFCSKLVAECSGLLTITLSAIRGQVIMENINYSFGDSSSKHGSEEDLCKMESPTTVHSSNQTKYKGTVNSRQVNISTKHFIDVRSRFTAPCFALCFNWNLNRSSKWIIRLVSEKL